MKKAMTTQELVMLIVVLLFIGIITILVITAGSGRGPWA